MAVGEPAQPQLAAEPVRGEPLGVAEEAGVPAAAGSSASGAAPWISSPAAVSTIRPGAASTAACTAPGANVPLPDQPAGGENVSTLPFASTAA